MAKKTSLLQEFKDFAMKGSVVDMAVGVIIGGAFGKIVTSFVSDVLMPPIGALLGDINFADMKYTLRAAQEGAEAVTLNYGAFLQNVIDFLIIAICIFAFIKSINKLSKKKEEEPAPAAPSKEEVLLTEIRDLLKNK